MPRKYIKKKTEERYSRDDLLRAASDVKNRRNISENQLGNGRPIALSASVKNQIAECLKARARMGYPCNKEELRDVTRTYVVENICLETGSADETNKEAEIAGKSATKEKNLIHPIRPWLQRSQCSTPSENENSDTVSLVDLNNSVGKILPSLIYVCSSGQKDYSVITDICHIVINERRISSLIPATALRSIAQQLVERSPKICMDVDDDRNLNDTESAKSVPTTSLIASPIILGTGP
ncbi:hypothetical protein ILUMI_07823 [Ignelater luminosus]|uniref:Uncharacterized protein n=1 Tax=Ignelater luminosus TaxID=2038154 RepID=A0A8K0D2R8_IGNLU|nr:hypothetical protein ILUMI_07823 [Ignelater luminosus]